jgi:hypothetical protein
MSRRQSKSGTMGKRNMDGRRRGGGGVAGPGARAAGPSEEGVFRQFHDLCPAIAEAETRTLILLRDDRDMPAGEYGFVEAFCSGPDCDCRRAMFFVMRRDRDDDRAPPRHVGTFAFGWEPLSFYRAWMRGDDPEAARAMKGPSVEPNGPPCAYGRPLLDLFVRLCLSDGSYVERVARHYARFKQALRQGAGAAGRREPPAGSDPGAGP